MRFRQGASLLIFVSLLCGCQTATVRRPLLPDLADNEPGVQLDFWHALAAQPLVSNDEALHALALYVDGHDQAGDYGQRVNQMKARKLLGADFHAPGDAAVTRGTVAVALVNLLELKNNLTLRLLGNSERYATREMEYQGIYPPSSPNQIFSGAEFVGIIGRVHDFANGNPADYPAAVMPSEIPKQSRPRPQPIGAMAQAPLRMSETDLAIACRSQYEDTSPIYAMIVASQLTLSATTSATTTAPAAHRAIITAIEGLASYRENENAKWTAVKLGVELTEQAEIRTGPTGAVQLRIPPDEVIAIDRLTTVRMLRIFRDGAKAATDLGIKYGRSRYDLEGGGLEHQSVLHSPNATLAVRGTRVSLFDQRPFTPQAVSLTGRAQFQALRKQAIAFGNRGQGRTRVNAASNNPAELAVAESVVDPSLPGARTESEAALVTTLISRGATVTLDRNSGIPIVRGGTPLTTPQVLSSVSGQLTFILHWNTDVNLDFAVSTPPTAKNPGGEFIYPIKGLNIAPSGGRTFFDHQGGSSKGGVEVISFPAGDLAGVYGLAAPWISGANSTTATFEGFYKGVPVLIDDGSGAKTTFTQLVTPKAPGLVLAYVDTPVLGALPLKVQVVQKAAPAPAPRPIKPVMIGLMPAKPRASK